MKNKYVPDIRFPEFVTDWSSHVLGDLIEISSASRVRKDEWKTSGVRFFRSSDVVANFTGKKNAPAFISEELYKKLSERSGVLQPDDLLVTGGGSIGIPYLVTDKEPLYFKDADLLWLKSANKVDGHFLYYYFVTPQLRRYISSITHIGTISHYTIEQSKATPITLPDVEEQTKIGIFFNKLDRSIAFYQQELDTLKQMKRGFLQKMFPKEGENIPEIRFPGFSGEWKKSKLGKVLNMGSKTPVQDTSEYRRLTVKLHNKGVTEAISERKLSDTRPFYQRFAGEIIIGKQNYFNGSVAIVPEKFNGFICSNAIMSFNSKNVDNNFIFNQISRPAFLNKRNHLANGTGQKELSEKEFLNFDVLLPSHEEQVQISGYFIQLDKTIELHERELEALKHTKKAFLQKMFI